MEPETETIDTSDPRQKWRFKCPECGSTNWRVHDGTFGCRRCERTLQGLIEQATGEFRPREYFDFAGTYADEKGAFGRRRDDL